MGSIFFKRGSDKFSDISPIARIKLSQIKIKDIDGQDKLIGDYITNKKAILFVNTASECGLTNKNYKELVEIYEQYKSQGFEVLGFPCNQFMGQESKCEFDIKNFAKNKFKVTFPLFSKIDVNGPNTHELYLYLKYNTPEFRQGNEKLKEIPWNFAKFLVDSQEKVVKYYEPNVEPNKIIPDIEKLIH